MKTKLRLVTLFILTSTLIYGQNNGKDETKMLEIKKLQIKAQYELDIVNLAAEKKMFQVQSVGKDSLLVIRYQAETQLADLNLEAQKELKELENKYKKNAINKSLRQKHFEKTYEELENKYEVKMSFFEDKYETAIKLLESRMETDIQLIETETKLKIAEIESKYKEEIALLEVE